MLHHFLARGMLPRFLARGMLHHFLVCSSYYKTMAGSVWRVGFTDLLYPVYTFDVRSSLPKAACMNCIEIRFLDG